MASSTASEYLQGALALTSVLPAPGSLEYTTIAPVLLPASASVLPADALPFSPLSHSLTRMSASTKPLRAPSPLHSLQRAAERRLHAAGEAAASFGHEVVDSAVHHLADIYCLMSAMGERLRLPVPMPAARQAGAQADRLHELMRSSGRAFAAVIPGDSVAELVVTQGIYNFLNIYNTVLICRIILTWFPNAPAAIVTPLSTITDPYLNLFRGLIPPLGGGLDFSPILAFLTLNVFTSAAAALPAEMPEGEGVVAPPVNGPMGGRRRPVKLTEEQREMLRAYSRAQNEQVEENKQA